MRILYFSDVHLEVRERQAPSSWTGVLPLGFGPDLSAFVGRVDLLVLAGDIGRLRSTRNVSPLSYAQQAAAFLGCRVILVPGNHEYYRGSFDGDRAALLAAEIPDVTVLDRGEARIGALRVLGATLPRPSPGHRATTCRQSSARRSPQRCTCRAVCSSVCFRQHYCCRPSLVPRSGG
jgi:hypothetical protein